jgi:hypothetical protein
MTRIECAIRPLSGDNGMWTLLFAAGVTGGQPSAIKTQGPFHGALAAESVMIAITESLTLQGYEVLDEMPTWSLHLQGELRRLNGDASRSRRTLPF